MAPKSDLLQGTLDLLILRTLSGEPMHGWGISQRIQQVSKDVLQVNQGSLYPALHRLEQQGLIEAEWGSSENNRQAKFYQLTRDGRKQLAEETTQLGTPGQRRRSSPRRTLTPGGPPLMKTRMFRRLSIRFGTLFRRDRRERELDAELRYHLDMLVEQNILTGMPPDAARREAMRVFGTLEGIKDEVRDNWLSRFVEMAAQDVRYGVRSLRRNPGFALVIIVTMALGIGANTAIFSVVNGVLLRPLPYQRRRQAGRPAPRQGDALANDLGFSVKDIVDYRQARSLHRHRRVPPDVLQPARPRRARAGVHRRGVGELLRGPRRETAPRPHLRRPPTRRPGAPAVLVLSHNYWERSFGGDPHIVGKVFRMNDKPHTVVGVMPAVPQYPLDVDVYMPSSACPFRSDPETASRGRRGC